MKRGAGVVRKKIIALLRGSSRQKVKKIKIDYSGKLNFFNMKLIILR